MGITSEAAKCSSTSPPLTLQPVKEAVMLANSTPPVGGGIYLIRLSDKHYYGGRTSCFRTRFRRHLRCLKKGDHPNKHMQNVFNKYGRFEPEIIAQCPPTEQEGVEQAWLDEHYGKTGCLNLSSSAAGSNTPLTPEGMAKRQETMRRRYGHLPKGRRFNLTNQERARRREAVVVMQTPEAREKMRQALTGKKIPAHVRRKMSENSARKGKPITDAMREGTVRSNKARAGWNHSASAKAKVSQDVKRRVWITKDGTTKRVYPEDLDNYLSEGWSRGRASR